MGKWGVGLQILPKGMGIKKTKGEGKKFYAGSRPLHPRMFFFKKKQKKKKKKKKKNITRGA